MPQDPFVREKFTRERNAAKKLAAEYFEAVPDRGRELAPSAIAKYRVHHEAAARADQRGVNVELTEIEIVILRGLDAKPALDISPFTCNETGPSDHLAGRFLCSRRRCGSTSGS